MSLNINIEKSILNSILFKPELLDEIAKTITPKDFFLSAHQYIFEGFLFLQTLGLPIDEEFLKRKCKNIDDDAMLTILATNPISNLTAYIKELKQDSLKRQVEAVAKEVACGNLKSIDQLVILKLDLDNVGNLRKLKKLDNTERFWDSQDMDTKEIENSKFEYLLDNFIVKNEITMVAARPNLGKSLTAFAIANMVLTEKIQTVFYLDGDNGITTIKERRLHHVKEKWGKRLRYIQGKNSSELQRIIKELLSLDLTDCLLVFDSIKNFMIGGDRDKNKDVSKVMEVLKTLRNNGATVIFLHHSNKPQKDVDDLMYAGSSAWGEDTGNAYILKKNEDKQSFLFHPIKKRTGDLESIAFKYNQEHHALIKVDFTEASETQEIEQINSEIIAFIEEQTQKPTYSQIMQHLTKEGFARNKSNEALQSGKSRYWKEEKLTQNNRSVYMLIKQPIVVEYKYISKSAPYKSDKSYKSYSMASLTPALNSDKWQEDSISETNPVIIHKNTHIDMPIL